MARSNKYASLNFNDIYEKRSATATSPNSSSSQATANHSSKTVISNSRIHGHMLVLSRPTPKPIAIPQSQPGPIQHQAKSLSPTPATSLSSSPADRARPESESDFISLRPQGRTGSSPIISSPSLGSPSSTISPLQSPVSKSDRFVPPHLRPGFKGREEKPGGRGGGGPRYGHSVCFPDPHGEDGRPKSGGGHDSMRTTGGEGKFSDFMNRPGSSG
ncbi:uncharacterized protein LOC115995751 [Ipomoea triloba]|uniref:uncharacterized protein LOC115995751 n=1 Tax=Ipomoea triloba TaxID=35885 RepID=UPI00125DEEC6|nr:uncharacterized protein LOC115995751 [Ipomoea triloba]